MNNIYDDTMNNNEPDYEGNLVFPPQEESVEKKCEKLEKQLEIAVEGLMTILNDGDDYWDKCQAQYYLKQIKDLDK